MPNLKIEVLNDDIKNPKKVTSRLVSDDYGSVNLFPDHAVFKCKGVADIITDLSTAYKALDEGVKKAGHQGTSDGMIENIYKGLNPVPSISVNVDSSVMTPTCAAVKSTFVGLN